MKAVSVFVLAAFITVASGEAVAGADEGKIEITTASDKAKEEYLEGLRLADNLQTAKSLEHFDRAIALDSTFAFAYLNRANNSITTKDFLDNLKKALEYKDKASEGERLLILAAEAGVNGGIRKQQEYLERAVELYPQDERAHLLLGAYFFIRQNYTQSVAEYKKAIAIWPTFASAYNNLGYAYRQLEDYSDAEQTFKKYTELIPDNPNPYDSYAELLLKIGRFDESIANYQKALSLDPSFTSSQIGLTMNYLYKGDAMSASNAVKRLSEMAKSPGERRQVCFVKAVVDADERHLDKAAKDFDEEFAIGREIGDSASMAQDLGAKANVLLEMGKTDDAVKTFDASAALMSANGFSPAIRNNALVVAHYNQARVALAEGDVTKAKAEANEYRQGAEKINNPNQLRFVHELAGIIALYEKDYDKALAELLQSNLQDPYNLYRMGLAYKGKNDKEHAKEYLTKAAEFDGLPNLNYSFIREKSSEILSHL